MVSQNKRCYTLIAAIWLAHRKPLDADPSMLMKTSMMTKRQKEDKDPMSNPKKDSIGEPLTKISKVLKSSRRCNDESNRSSSHQTHFPHRGSTSCHIV